MNHIWYIRPSADVPSKYNLADVQSSQPVGDNPQPAQLAALAEAVRVANRRKLRIVAVNQLAEKSEIVIVLVGDVGSDLTSI
jgi:hypothetical protein